MRVLKREGREKYREWVESLDENPDASLPLQLLEQEEFSFGIPESSEAATAIFETKYELAEALLPLIEEVENLNVNHDCWPGIWDSLALTYFESICPRDSGGYWNPNRSEHYVYDPDYKLRHRHRIYGPVTLYRSGRESLHPFFCKKPSVLGDFEEQIGSRQELAGNPTALRVLQALYQKGDGSSLISGYTNSKNYEGFKKKLPIPGSLRRFTVICEQFKRTYDLAGISYEGFTELLPEEFSEWLEN